MKKEYYYIYCNGILGVKTNSSNFKWIYGSIAPTALKEDYEQCIVKFDISVVSEKKLNDCKSCEHRFQAYKWDEKENMILYRRTFFSKLKIGYNIKFFNNNVEVCVGKTYLKLIQKRVMNLHGMYYLLSDIANLMLLKNGFLTLYASSMYYSPKNRGIVCFAPPNAGKTLTATGLREFPGYCFLGEDIVITDGKKLFACPWTSSYRKQNSIIDSAGALGRVSNKRITDIRENCDLTDLVVLASGNNGIFRDKQEIQRQISILSGYLFNYYSSPILKILAFFNKEYDKPWNEYANKIIKEISMDKNCYLIQTKEPLEYSKLIHYNIIGGE